MPTIPAELLQTLSALSTPVIGVCFILHLVWFVFLWFWAGRDLKIMLTDFDSFTRGLKHRSVIELWPRSSDQLNAFLQDIRDVLDDPHKQVDRQALCQRMHILDERRRYLQSAAFETSYNICRTMIEAYPLAGILGTLIAIAAALQVGAGGGEATVAAIVKYFGDAIWSTVVGLIAAMVLMFLNSAVETKFRRLSENRLAIRETVTRAKRELTLSLAESPA